MMSFSDVGEVDSDEYRVVGLTSPEFQFFVKKLYLRSGARWRSLKQKGVNLFKSLGVTLGVLMVVGLAGCGKPATGPAETKNTGSKTGSPNLDPSPAPTVLVISEKQLEVVPDSKYLVWYYDHPSHDLAYLKSLKELRLISQALNRYDFNESDMYLDPYDDSDQSVFPMMQVTVPTQVIAKSGGEVRLNFPGQEIEAKLNMLQEFSGRRQEKYRRIRLRILMTDRNKEGNPIELMFISNLWESPE